jgi:hypothetical protein
MHVVQVPFNVPALVWLGTCCSNWMHPLFSWTVKTATFSAASLHQYSHACHGGSICRRLSIPLPDLPCSDAVARSYRWRSHCRPADGPG